MDVSTVQKSFLRVDERGILHYPSHNEIYEATVVSRAGKTSGKHKGWFNVEYTKPDSQTGHIEAADFNNVKHWEQLPCDENAFATIDGDALEAETSDIFQPAKVQEVSSWVAIDVCEEAPYTGQTKINTKWVLPTKDAFASNRN